MSREKTVFVVHGRNKQARNAIFTFLRSLDLSPLEWDQARQQTGKATPTTLEIVRAGIEAAQCVLVLFTGDDLARLRPEYGDELYYPQPRPNVLFEAGWGLATAGQERTILARLGPVRPFSDIDGLHQLQLDNTAQRRKELVERLADAGCALVDSGSDYLSPETGGDFPDPEPSVLDQPESLTKSDRGRFTSFVADSALLYTLSPIESLTALRKILEVGSSLDLKYHYIGATCASYWLDLAGHPEYGHETLRSIVEKSTTEIVNAILDDSDHELPEIDLISLGPGDGRIDARLLYRLNKNSVQVPYYYCVDISFELLQQTVATVLRASYLDPLEMRIKAVYGDFTELEKIAPIYLYDPTKNLFSLLGYTFGNHDEGTLLQSIRAGMNEGDYLLLDARLHELDWNGDRRLTDEEKRSIQREYRHDKNERFAFGPVEMATAAEPSDVTFEYDISRRITNVPNAINIITYCRNLKTNVKGSRISIERERLDLAATTQYSYNALKDWLPTRGFRLTWSATVQRTGLFLLKRDKS